MNANFFQFKTFWNCANVQRDCGDYKKGRFGLSRRVVEEMRRKREI